MDGAAGVQALSRMAAAPHLLFIVSCTAAQATPSLFAHYLLSPYHPPLLPLCIQYKFIVDGDWKYDPNQPAMYDEIGNVNNVIEVQEYVPENLENVSGFDPPPSPPSR